MTRSASGWKTAPPMPMIGLPRVWPDLFATAEDVVRRCGTSNPGSTMAPSGMLEDRGHGKRCAGRGTASAGFCRHRCEEILSEVVTWLDRLSHYRRHARARNVYNGKTHGPARHGIECRQVSANMGKRFNFGATLLPDAKGRQRFGGSECRRCLGTVQSAVKDCSVLDQSATAATYAARDRSSGIGGTIRMDP